MWFRTREHKNKKIKMKIPGAEGTAGADMEEESQSGPGGEYSFIMTSHFLETGIKMFILPPSRLTRSI